MAGTPETRKPAELVSHCSGESGSPRMTPVVQSQSVRTSRTPETYYAIRAEVLNVWLNSSKGISKGGYAQSQHTFLRVRSIPF